MTDKGKLEKIKALADKMYSRMAYLTSDTRPIRQAMDEYHQFIINEYHKEEPVSEDLCDAANDYCVNIRKGYPRVMDETDKYIYNAFMSGTKWQKQKDSIPVCEDLEEVIRKYEQRLEKENPATEAYDFASAIRFGANWKEQQLMAKAVNVEVKVDAGGYPYIPQMELYDYDKDIPLAKEGDKYKVILIKEE